MLKVVRERFPLHVLHLLVWLRSLSCLLVCVGITATATASKLELVDLGESGEGMHVWQIVDNARKVVLVYCRRGEVETIFVQAGFEYGVTLNRSPLWEGGPPTITFMQAVTLVQLVKLVGDNELVVASDDERDAVGRSMSGAIESITEALNKLIIPE